MFVLGTKSDAETKFFRVSVLFDCQFEYLVHVVADHEVTFGGEGSQRRTDGVKEIQNLNIIKCKTFNTVFIQ